ncbi:MAG: cyclic nucleotide-binding domain-containing protein [Deltaproteobacteria bacterium]|nr:cyclic nucleotide-binding domain-containing protein [Deltaproteobacteria bacterium]MBN2674474.1 cyclic nucleotide-binding domain-containing protein [Deltaproteobacteria bacterium]
MDIAQIVPGCFHLQHKDCAALFGSPPEILKFVLKAERTMPQVVILPDAAYVSGVSQIALEFLAYWHLFFDRKNPDKRFRVVGTADMCRRAWETMMVTLFGPTREQMKSWKVSKSRISTLSKMTEYMAIKVDDKTMSLDEMLEFEIFESSESGVSLCDGGPVIFHEGVNRYRVVHGRKEQIIDLNFSGEQMPLMIGPEAHPEIPQIFRIKLLGTYSGFDTEGPTTGMVMWINCNGFLVDGPVGTSEYLRQLGIPKSDLAGVILSHVHDDHCTLMDIILSEQTANIITTREIYESMLIKISHVLGESIDSIRNYLTFTEVIPGKPIRMYGATWEFFYTVHSIPTIGFRVTVRSQEGEDYTIVHSSDTAGFAKLDEMAAAGAITDGKRDRMKQLVKGGEKLVMIDGGGPPIHGDPADYDDIIRKNPQTDFLFYHVNPEHVDTEKYSVATPGWSKTYLESNTLPQSLVFKLLKTMNLLDVTDLFWVNVVFSQGEVLEVGPGVEVVSQGQKGDSFYFILSGSGEVLERSEGGPRANAAKKIALLESGDFFGEMSIIRDAQRNAAFRTLSACVLFRLPGDTFLEFVEANELKARFERLWLSRDFISQVKLFRNLHPHAKHEISLLAEEKEYAKGTYILRQGGKSDDFYIITSGVAEVVKRSRRGETVEEELRVGDFFGENVAMGYSHRRNASIIAKTRLQAVRIAGADLRRIAENAPVLIHELHLVMRERGMTDIPSNPRESTGF